MICSQFAADVTRIQVADCHGRKVRVLQMVGAGAQGAVFKAEVPTGLPSNGDLMMILW